MRVGIVGLGRMGAGFARQAIDRGHGVVGFNADRAVLDELAKEGVEATDSITALAARLEAPRVVFVWVPHGEPTEQVVRKLGEALEPGDVAVDGGNSHWDDSRRRHAELSERGVRFLDMGTSGGLAGACHGACFMVGGEREAFDLVAPTRGPRGRPQGGVLRRGAPAPVTSSS